MRVAFGFLWPYKVVQYVKKKLPPHMQHARTPRFYLPRLLAHSRNGVRPPMLARATSTHFIIQIENYL
jgi:hypothetical protein